MGDLGTTMYSGERTVAGAGGRKNLGVVGMGCGVVSGGFSLLMGLMMLVKALTGPSSELGVGLGATTFFGGGGLCFALLIGGVGFALFRWAKSKPASEQSLSVHESGVVFSVDEVQTELTWEEVDGFFCPPTAAPMYGIKISMPYSWFVVEGKGQRFEARGFSQLKEMGDHIEDAVSPIQLQKAHAALQAGESVNFGKVVCSPEGISGFSFGMTKWEDLKALGNGKHNQLAIREAMNPVAMTGPFWGEVQFIRVLFTVAQNMREQAKA